MSAVRAPEKIQKSRSANAPGGRDAYSAFAASAPRHIPPYLCIPCGQVSQSSLGGVNARTMFKNNIPALANGCIILHSRVGERRFPATLNLKRPCKLPNCSREDRIRGGAFPMPGGKTRTSIFASSFEQ